jgi:4-hydroxy-tetrahydrodipicolinate synthase
MKEFKRVYSAVVTPFLDGKLDLSSFENLLKSQLDDGIKGFVVNGTTGESPTLTWDEVEQLFKLARKTCPSDVTLILGTGSNSTQKTVDNNLKAAKLGADGVLVVVPYYNKPTQEGLLEHFKAAANAASIPNILYNVPGRTITALEVDTIKRLSEHPNILGIKEASGKIDFDTEVRRQCGDQFVLLSGDDGTYEEFLNIGGHGCISVASMIMPKNILSGKTKDVRSLIDLLFIEPNPTPIKYLLYLKGTIKSPECRLPLLRLSEKNQDKLKTAFTKAGYL